MIHLEHPQAVRVRRPNGVSVEPGTENDELPHPCSDGEVECILRDATACDHEMAYPKALGSAIAVDEELRVLTEDVHGERIAEHAAALQNLMRRPMPRRAQRGATRATGLHARTVSAFGRRGRGISCR